MVFCYMIETKKMALVVAHSDDEILWAGGLVLRYPGNWTIICCTTPVKEPERIEQFHKACAVLGATASKMHPYEDISKKTPLPALDDVDLEPFDHIVTHNRWGEYGHRHHKHVHRYVTHKYAHKPITTFGFRHFLKPVLGHLLQSQGLHKITLTPQELARKMEALKQYNRVMDSGRPLWEELIELYCRKQNLNLGIETFDGAWFE